MKLFIYLIVWCAIFNENQSLSKENHGNETDTPSNDLNKATNNSNLNLSNVFTATLKHRTVETTIPPTRTERSTIHLPSTKEFSNENKQYSAETELTKRGDIVNISRPPNSEVSTDRHKTTEIFSDKNKKHEVMEPTDGREKTNNSTKMLPTSTETIVSSKTTTISTPRSSYFVKERTSDPDLIYLPKYAIGLIMFAMALMFFIIMALLFMLYKIKQEKRRRDSMNVAIQHKNEMNYKYSRQLSGETSNVSTLLKDKTKDSKLILTRSDSKALFFNNLDTVDARKEKSPIDHIKTSKITMPESNPTKAKGRPPTLTRILKQPSINHVPISREQMSKLCEGVLSKTKKSNEAISLSDLDKILNESRKEEKEKTDLEKFQSTPELDSDMYDMLPTPSPRKFFNNSDGVNSEEFDDEVYDNPPKHNIKKFNNPLNKYKTEESDDEFYDNPVSNKHDNEVFDDGIYDNPPPNHNRKRNVVVSTDHEDYVMPLTKDNGLYDNAKVYADYKISKNSL